jgi:chemotaxis protein CheD
MVATKTTVGISEVVVSSNPDEMLITYSLGSCLGVTAHDPVSLVGGLIHCMLPLSNVDGTKARDKPAMFVDSGIPLLFEALYDLGAQKGRIILKAAGCAQIMDPGGHFKIGERNLTVLRKLLWKNNILITSQSIGGNVARTLSLDIGSGKTYVKIQGVEEEL